MNADIAVTACGLKIRFGQYYFRLWHGGLEYGNRLGGRYFLFPWSKP